MLHIKFYKNAQADGTGNMDSIIFEVAEESASWLHFYDEDSFQLIDIKNENVSINNLPSAPSGKKIKEIEITIRVASNNQKQKNH